MVLDFKRLRKTWAIFLFFVGAVGMFLTNLLRIFLLFIVGVYISPSFAVGMFHTNVGWILFIIYFFIYWWIVSKVIYKKHLKPRQHKKRDKKGHKKAESR
jgi:exosortase/archaeosortase family protein